MLPFDEPIWMKQQHLLLMSDVLCQYKDRKRMDQSNFWAFS